MVTVKELIERLEEMPEDETVYIPDFNGIDDKEVVNVVFATKGVLIDYI